MPSLFKDIRYALRQLRKNLGFTSVAVLSLALAIGANTTIFSFANQVLFVQLRVPHSGQLRILSLEGRHTAIHSSWGSSWSEGDLFHTTSFSWPVYQELRKQNVLLSDIAGFKQISSVNVAAEGNAQAAKAELVSGNFYGTMQLKPELGRPILPSDDTQQNASYVAVISDAFWHRNFGGSPDVLGRTFRVNTTPVTIVGVNPPGFTGPDGMDGSAPQIFLPLSMVTLLAPDTGLASPTGNTLWWVQLIARARPGVSEAKAEAALNAIVNAAVRSSVTVAKDETIPRLLISDGSRGDTTYVRWIAQPIHILFGLAGLVLLLACANIANLMLARATVRQREIGVRMALGAKRTRILRQVLTESLLLSVLGGVAGLVLGFFGRNLIPWLLERGWDGGEINTPFDWRVFAFTSTVVLTTGILFGIAPAWRSLQVSINATLKEGARGATRQRKAWTGKIIVGFQIALSTLLVIAAAVFTRTVLNLNAVNPGFHADNLLLFSVNPPSSRYPDGKDLALDHRLEETFAGVPGVEGVTLANVPLIAGSMWNSEFEIEGSKGSAYPKEDMRNYPDLDDVGANFFTVMEIPILAGRSFGAQDTETSAPVSIVNQTLARQFFQGDNPIGKRFRMNSGGPRSRWTTIVGICADTRYHDLKQPAPAIHFELYRQSEQIGGVTFIVRSSLAASTLMPSLREVAKRIDPDLPLTQVRTQQQQIGATMQQERMFASLTSGFGILALALACVGVYGIMAYLVSQRTNEIGIKLALGAGREQIQVMVLREAGWLAASGIAVGLGATLLLARLIKDMLYGIVTTDATTLGVCTLLLGGVAFVAGWVPARRASHVDPIQALRSE